jgi:hypothetical protein
MRMRSVWAVGVLMLSAVLIACCGTAFRASAGTSEIKVQGKRPQLMFACELDTEKLKSLFADPAVIGDLKDLNAGISLALVDLSPGRAQVVQRLNEAGISVVAWMALPKEQGYYLNADNAEAAAARFAEFEKWTAENGLRWAGVGLDIEPSLGDWTTIQQGRKWRLVRSLVGRAFDGERIGQARAAYAALIRQMQSRGYTVQTYQLLFLADERRAHSTVLERLFGVVDVRSDDEVLMVYSSFNHALDAALVWGYGPDAHTIAVGSTATAGNSELDAKFGPLNWDEFSRNLIVASHFSHEVGVYSLEGCVRQGFLPRLKTLDWTQPVTLSSATVEKVRRFRQRVQTMLWIASHIVYFAVATLAVIVWLALYWRRRRRLRVSRMAIAAG